MESSTPTWVSNDSATYFHPLFSPLLCSLYGRVSLWKLKSFLIHPLLIQSFPTCVTSYRFPPSSLWTPCSISFWTISNHNNAHPQQQSQQSALISLSILLQIVEQTYSTPSPAPPPNLWNKHTFRSPAKHKDLPAIWVTRLTFARCYIVDGTLCRGAAENILQQNGPSQILACMPPYSVSQCGFVLQRSAASYLRLLFRFLFFSSSHVGALHLKKSSPTKSCWSSILRTLSPILCRLRSWIFWVCSIPKAVLCCVSLSLRVCFFGSFLFW